MRRLTIAALILVATPALAQTGPIQPAPTVSAPMQTAPLPTGTADNAVRCNCAPVAAAAPVVHRVRRPRVARIYRRAPAAVAYGLPPANFGYATATTAYAPQPLLAPPPRVRGILGPIAQNEESIVYYGLGYTDGYIGSEAGAGGPGPTGAGY